MVPYYSLVAIRTNMRYAISFSYNKYLSLLFLPSCEVQRVKDNQAQIPLLLLYHHLHFILNFTPIRRFKSPGRSSPNPLISFHFPFPTSPSPYHTKKQSRCQHTASGMWQFLLSAKLFHTFNFEVKRFS